jgi:anti-sigma factor RsiW
MECKKMEEVILTDYIDGRLEGAALKEAEEHLALCAGCRGLAQGLASVADLLRSARREEPPARIWEKIRAGIMIPERKPALTFFSRARPVFAMAAAAAAIAVIFIAVGPVFLKQVSPAIEQYDILSLVVSDANGDANGDASDYDMGTPAEEYFL